MSSRLALWYPVLILILLTGLSFWLERATRLPEPRRDGSERHDPDYWLQRFTATQMEPSGQVRYVLKGEEMRHYPDDDSTELDQPKYTQYHPDQPPITAVAPRATVAPDGNQVFMYDNVLITRHADALRREMTLRTTYLHILGDANIARTDQPVVIEDGSSRVTGVGMEMNQDKRTVVLKSKVRGVYVKNTKKK